MVCLQVSMSSTSIVVKCLEDSRSSNMAHGQITIGTLILQDCLVGLLFAFVPVLAHNAKSKGGVDNMVVLRLLLKWVYLQLAHPIELC